MSKITKVVLTGGPCAGKTTALAKVVEHFSNLGYQVFTVPEVPTMFAVGGVDYLTKNQSLFYQAEKATLLMQLEIEDRFESIAAESEKPVLLVCDRGTMDISVYLSPETWQAITREVDVPVEKLRDARYDAVLHLVTAADGAADGVNFASEQISEEVCHLADALVRLLEYAGLRSVEVALENTPAAVAPEFKLEPSLVAEVGVILDPEFSHFANRLSVFHGPPVRCSGHAGIRVTFLNLTII